jgi:hypothetical protein
MVKRLLGVEMLRNWAAYGHICLVLTIVGFVAAYGLPASCRMIEREVLGPQYHAVSDVWTYDFAGGLMTGPLPWLVLATIVCYSLAVVEWWVRRLRLEWQMKRHQRRMRR